MMTSVRVAIPPSAQATSIPKYWPKRAFVPKMIVLPFYTRTNVRNSYCQQGGKLTRLYSLEDGQDKAVRVEMVHVGQIYRHGDVKGASLLERWLIGRT